jgi:hypothetical protein
MPLAYFGVAPQMGMPVAAGGDVLIPHGSLIRPRIGGCTKRSKQRKQTKRRKQRGGFVPTIMEGFCMAASKYIVPLALFAGYKWMTRSKKGKKT